MRFEGPVPRKPVDILFYIQAFDGGGAERVTIQLANYWYLEGKSVVFVVNRDTGAIRSELDPEVPVVILNPLRNFLAFGALGRLLRQLRPCLTISALTYCNISAGLARLWSRADGKLLLVEHIDLSAVLPKVSKARQWYYRLAVPFAYRCATHVSGVSSDAAYYSARIARLPDDRVAVLRNPVWPARISDRPPTEVHPWFTGDAPVLVNVGRLTEQKNHRNLLEAFAELRRRRPAKLIILGIGPLLDKLRRRAEELGVATDVHFAGFRSDVPDFLHWAQCFVLSSDFEALPLALIEALQHDIAIVSTECSSGPGEILENGKHGVLVPPRDAKALAAGVEKALGLPISRAERDRILELYSIEATTRRYLEFLGEA